MPTYSYQCSDEHITDEHRSMDNRRTEATCHTCHKPAKFIITVNKVKPTFGNQDTLWNMRERKRLGTG